jgi:flagellar hook assembly protein FlgD
VDLSGGYPNPFRDDTRFSLRIDHPATADVSVYSTAGRHIATIFEGHASSGGLPLRWDGRDAAGGRLPSGVYFLRAAVGELSTTTRVTLLR